MRLHWNRNSNSSKSSKDTFSVPSSTAAGPDLSALGRRFYARTVGRGALLLLVVILATLTLPAQMPITSAQPPLDPALAITTIPLWPHGAPGAQGTADVDSPTLTVFRPYHPNGTAIIIAPGGGYVNLASIHEGRELADLLAQWNVTAFVLRYRLGPTYTYPIPLEDARRAIRLVRSLAPGYGYSPDRIGMMGFSAGGHLTAAAATLPKAGKPDDPDPVEHESSALNYQVLIYPWLNAMEPQVAGPKGLMINYCSITRGLTQADCARLNAQYTPATHVTTTTPPAFIAATSTDDTVPVTTSVRFYSAMHAAGADAELHIFAEGPHGFGTGGTDPVLSQWPALLENWMRAHGWFNPTQPAR